MPRKETGKGDLLRKGCTLTLLGNQPWTSVDKRKQPSQRGQGHETGLTLNLTPGQSLELDPFPCKPFLSQEPPSAPPTHTHRVPSAPPAPPSPTPTSGSTAHWPMRWTAAAAPAKPGWAPGPREGTRVRGGGKG